MKTKNWGIRRISALVMTVILTAGSLMGCGNSKPADTDSGSGSAASPSEEGKVTLKYYTWSDTESYTKEIIENYNNSQDKVVVEMVSMPSATYDDKLKVMLSAGSDADIVNVRTLDQVLQFKEAKALYDISDNVKNSDLDISKYGSMWDSSYPDGKITALPLRSSCWMLFYNVDILEEAGIELPEQLTWSEYGDIIKSLTSGDGSKYGGCWVDWNVYQCLGTQMGTYLTADDITDVRNGLEILNRFFNEDESVVPLAEIKANDTQWRSDFETGRVAMIPQGEWFIDMLMSDAKEGKTDVNWEVTNIPIPEGAEPGATWGAYQFAAIPAEGKHVEESYDFLKYLCGEGGSGILPKYGILPAYGGDSAKKTFDEEVGKESVSNVAFSAKIYPETPSYDKYSDLKVAFAEHAELYLFGEKTLDETMQNFEKQRTDIMSK